MRVRYNRMHTRRLFEKRSWPDDPCHKIWRFGWSRWYLSVSRQSYCPRHVQDVDCAGIWTARFGPYLTLRWVRHPM